MTLRMKDRTENLDTLRLKVKELTTGYNHLVQLSICLSDALKRNNSFSSSLLDLLTDFLQFLSVNSIENATLQKVFDNLSLEYCLVPFIADDQTRTAALKMLTFISTHPIQPFFSYQKLWNSLQIRGLQEIIFCTNLSEIVNSTALFDQLHLIWEFRKFKVPPSVIPISLENFKNLIALNSSCKIRSIILHIVVSWWDNFLPKETFDFEQFLPSVWSCRTCKYCKLLFDTLAKKIYFHLESSSLPNERLALFLCNLASTIEHLAILRWAWNKTEMGNVYWKFFISNPDLSIKFVDGSVENDSHFFVCLYHLLHSPSDRYLTACANNVFSLKNLVLVSKFFNENSGILFDNFSSINFASRRWSNLLVGLARNETFCREFLKCSWPLFRESIANNLRSLDKSLEPAGNCLDIAKIKLLRLLFEFPLNRYSLIQLEGQHFVADLLARIDPGVENGEQAIKLLFDCLFNVQFISNALGSIDSNQLSSILVRHFRTFPNESLYLLNCLSTNKIHLLNPEVYEQLYAVYFENEALAPRALAMLQQVTHYFSGMKYLQGKFFNLPSEYQKYFALFFDYPTARQLEIACEADERVLVQHHALTTPDPYTQNVDAPGERSENLAVEFTEFISSNCQSVMIDKARLAAQSQFFSFLFSSFQAPYRLSSSASLVLQDLSSFLSSHTLPSQSIARYVELLKFADKYCLSPVAEYLERRIFDFFDPILVAKSNGVWFGRQFQRSLALRLVQGASQYCRLGEAELVDWAIGYLSNRRNNSPSLAA